MVASDARSAAFSVPSSASAGPSTGQPSQPNQPSGSSETADTSGARSDEPRASSPPAEAGDTPFNSRDYASYPQLVTLLEGWRGGNVPLSEVILWGFIFIQQLESLSSADRPHVLTSFISQADKGKGKAPHVQSDDEVWRSLEMTFDREARAVRAEPGEDDDSDFGEGGKRHRDLESDDAEPQGRGKKLRKEDFPWFESTKRFAEEKLTPSMRETRQIIALSRQDVATVSYWAQEAAGAPASFPNTEWNNIIHGRTVDLDNVHATMYLPQLLQENVERVGNVSILVSAVDKSKSIKTAIDWASAWRKTIKATTVVFPHRLEELEEYTTHIESLFRATIPSMHDRILLLDRAIRAQVGGGQSSSLLDDYGHRRLHTAIMLPGGVEF